MSAEASNVRRSAEAMRDLALWLYEEVVCDGDPSEIASMADQLSSDASNLRDDLEELAERQGQGPC
jgi:hypothetical protein